MDARAQPVPPCLARISLSLRQDEHRLGGNTNIKNQTFFSPQDLPGSNMGDTESLDVCADSNSNETTNCHNLNFYCHKKIINKTQTLYTGATASLNVYR